jgi:hypothetical protein
MGWTKGAGNVRGMFATIVLVLATITGCGPWDNSRPVGQATQVAAATATATRPWCPTATPSPTVFVPPTGPPAPPPSTPTRQPPTPTGPRPTPLPLPTLEPLPPTPTWVPIVFPTEPPTNLVTPVGNWLTYRNLDIGFSFEYPANWQIQAPDQSCRPLNPTGTSIEVRNYNVNTAVEKGLLLPQMLRVRIGVGPYFAQYGTVDQWALQLRHDGTPSPDVSFSPIEHLSVSGLPAVRWTVKAPLAPEGSVEVLTGKGIWSFYITAYPASSQQLATFDRIVSSFQIPQGR